MYKTKLCLGLSSSFSLPYEQQIRTLRQIGFEGFFTGCRARRISRATAASPRKKACCINPSTRPIPA